MYMYVYVVVCHEGVMCVFEDIMKLFFMKHLVQVPRGAFTPNKLQNSINIHIYI